MCEFAQIGLDGLLENLTSEALMASVLSDLEGQRYDVVIIGGGINGASAAQNLAAGGYHCLVADKGDFGSGASGRSGRMLHIGLRFFEARNPILRFARRPSFLWDVLRSARQSMLAVSEHLANPGRLIVPYRMCFPVFCDGNFKTWHLRTALRLLGFLGDGRFSLEQEVVTTNYSEKIPFFRDFRDQDKIRSIACYNEFKFDWPERFCIDMLLDAKRNGATLLNYCTAHIKGRLPSGDWLVSLMETANQQLAAAEVRAPVVLNLTGTWIDKLLPRALPKPIVYTSKGSHLVVELPETYQGFGVATLNRLGLPFYILPLHKNLFSVGVTELPFEGDASRVSCSDEEIDFLIGEFNSLLPGRQLSRKDVVSTWAGVRPLSAIGEGPETRLRTLHDLAAQGYPGILALTGGPIMSHRSSGRLILRAVSKKLKPSGEKGKISYEPFEFYSADNSRSFLPDEPYVRIADLENSVAEEHAKTLTDVLLRRTGLAWRRRLTRPEAEEAAEIVGPLLHWPEEERRDQVERFMAFQEREFRTPSLAK